MNGYDNDVGKNERTNERAKFINIYIINKIIIINNLLLQYKLLNERFDDFYFLKNILTNLYYIYC